MKTERACLYRHSNGTKTLFFPLSSTDARNMVAHYGGMFNYFKGTFCLIHLPTRTYLNITYKVKVTRKAHGCLGRLRRSCSSSVRCVPL